MQKEPEFKSADSAGINICYNERGSGDPLVLIMGFGADGSLWEKHAAIYEKHFRCIIPDNRGVGRSDQPRGPYTTKEMAEDIIAVLDHANVPAARVIGISMGGAIAQQLAIHFPNRVTSIILVSTWARFNHYTKCVYESLKHIRTSSQPRHFTELLQLWIFAPPYYENNYADLKAGIENAAINPSTQTTAGFDGQLDACISHNVVDELSKIKCPVLITVGLMDIFTPPEYSKELRHHIRGAKMISFPDAGHAHHWEHLDNFNDETLQFLLNH